MFTVKYFLQFVVRRNKTKANIFARILKKFVFRNRKIEENKRMIANMDFILTIILWVCYFFNFPHFIKILLLLYYLKTPISIEEI